MGKSQSEKSKSKMNIFKLFSCFLIFFMFEIDGRTLSNMPLCSTTSSSSLPCFLHAHNIVKFRLHTDIIQFFDEYVTGRADFIRQNELNREAAEFNKHHTEKRHHEELTNHKIELFNLTNQYLNSQVTFWTKKQDQPISQDHESWLTNYKTRH